MSKESPQSPPGIAFEHVIGVAKEVLLQNGHHTPTLVVDGSRQPAILQISPIGETHEQRALQLHLAGINLALDGRLGRLRQVFLITEGWMSRIEGERALPIVPPSQDPDRIEVLAVSGQNAVTRKTQMALFEMVRDEQQKLIEIKDLVQTDSANEEAESPLLDAFIEDYREYRRYR